jgi:hypothetical protein
MCCSVLNVSCRLYAVGFATRQLTGTSKLLKDSPGQLNLGNSFAHRAAQQLLHDTAASMVTTPILTGILQDPTAGTNLNLATVLPDVVSQLFVVPGVLPEGEPLLQMAVTGPSDPLVPLQQQRELRHVRCVPPSVGGCRCNVKAFARMLNEKAYARSFVRLGCPQLWQQYQREMWSQLQPQQQQDSSDSDSQESSEQQQQDPQSQQQQQQQGSEGERQQQWQQMWERERQRERRRRRRGASVLKLSDDTSKLMLLDPVPAECLLDPEVWWAWHEELTGLDSCDICGKELDPQVGILDQV